MNFQRMHAIESSRKNDELLLKAEIMSHSREILSLKYGKDA